MLDIHLIRGLESANVLLLMMLGDVEALMVQRRLIDMDGAQIAVLSSTVQQNAWPAEDAAERLWYLFLVFIRKLVKLLLNFIDIGFDDISYDFEAELLRGRLLIFSHSLLDSLLRCNVTCDRIPTHLKIDN